MDLNQEQQAVVSEPDGPRAVLAGPGSGKTSTMVAFIKSLIARHVPASEIRAVTFSKEMASTLEKRIGIKGIASTFHSLGYSICSMDGERKPVEPELRHRLMSKLIAKFGLDYHELDNFISARRRENMSPADALESGEHDYLMARAYGMYEDVRAAEGWMDFDSMLCDSVQILEDARKRTRWQMRYLIVDEAQDTDNLQWRMMQLMSEQHGNITVVGDPGQAIYAFRGAAPENITHFQQWFPGGRYYYLGRNYRSTGKIVDFVRDNTPRAVPKDLKDRMLAARTETGKSIALKMYWWEEDEAESALALAQHDPLNSIILGRTNHAVGLLERICSKNNIRYHLLGKSGFWKQGEVRKALDLMKQFAAGSTELALNMVLPRLEAKYAVDDRTERDNDALDNLKTLRTIGGQFKQAREFLVYANKMVHRRNDPHGVSISTVHQAKGGEWKNVYVIGANAKGFPHPKGDPDEEARIYYVAVSRAIDSLRISFAGTPSPYLRKYLTDEILDKLREHAEEVEKLQAQAHLFEEAK